MKFIPKLMAAGLVATVATTAFAADHKDGSAVVTDPSTDINDVFVFPKGNNVVLAMTVSPFADATAKFSDAAKYVFHVDSYTAFGGTKTKSTDVICTFTTAQVASCWVGTADYVTGDASPTAGISSASGKVKVFAGPRADPFYFYLTGFNTARTAAIGLIPGLLGAGKVFMSGCPDLDGYMAGTSATARGLLQTNDPTKNDFATANVLAITLEIDKSLLTSAPDETIAVWASTNH
jgi:hypothetical protein